MVCRSPPPCPPPMFLCARAFTGSRVVGVVDVGVDVDVDVDVSIVCVRVS